ncbi:MAG: hypothetical protein HZC55_11215 [Verrucomicrobia bacterium]|nr:hypothetical protein [Verrucomicrobiota bacterium]
MPALSKRCEHLLPLAGVQVVGLVCGLIGVRWSSTVVPPEAMGVFGLLLTAQLIASTVTHHGLIKHVQQHWTRHTSARQYGRFLLTAARQPFGWLAAALALVTAYFTWTGELTQPVAWWAWLLAANLLSVVAATAQAALQAEERYWAGLAVATVGSASRSFLPPLLVTVGAGATLPLLGTGFLLHAAVFALVAVAFLRSAWHRPAASAGVAASPAAPLVHTFMQVGLYGWVAAIAPRWFAARLLDEATTGYFMLAINLAMIAPAAASMITQSYSFPVLFDASRRGAGPAELARLTHRPVLVMLAAAQVGLLVLDWVAPRLVGILIDHQYAPAMAWILAAGGSIIATLSTPLFCNLLVARGQAQACVGLSVASAALRLLLLGALVAWGDSEIFRLGLCLLPWPTVALEWWLAHRWAKLDTP